MGGSGGSSGKVEYPRYLESRHAMWLDAVYSDIDVANPYTSKNAPSISALTSTSSANTDFKAYLDGRKADIQGWLASGAVASPEVTALAAEIDDAIAALTSSTTAEGYLNDQIAALNAVDDLAGAVDVETVLYPRFEAGMRDINAVQSSAHVIGKALIESDYASRMIQSKYEMLGTARVAAAKTAIDKQSLINDLRKLRATLASVIDQSYNEARKMLAGLDPFYDSLYARIIDLGRLTVIAEYEQAAMDADFDEKAGRWKLENWQTACNVMAAISGGTAVSTKGTNKIQSALAGGLSGAAAGAMIGAQLAAPMPMAGAVIGATIGIGAALL